MSLSAIMSTATSGMMAAQTGLRVTSDNIANVNTAGYVRKTISQSNLISNGMGVGVSIEIDEPPNPEVPAKEEVPGNCRPGRQPCSENEAVYG